MCRTINMGNIMKYSFNNKNGYRFVDTRPLCANCREKKADVMKDHYFFCGDCALEMQNSRKTTKEYLISQKLQKTDL